MHALIEVNPLLQRERTGIPNYVEHLCRGLLAQAPPGDRFTLWAPDLERDPLPELKRHRFRGRRLFPRAVLERLWELEPVEAIPGDVDLYHLPFPGMPAPGRGPRTKVVVSILDLAFARYPETVVDPAYTRMLARWFPAQVDAADRILTISESTKRDLVEILDAPEDRIDVTYPGTDLRPPSHEGLRAAAPVLERLGVPPRYLLSLGTQEPRKNLPSVLRAVHRLRGLLEARGVALCLAGGARWKYREADRLIAELGLEGLVRPLGFVPREVLPALYAGAEGFLYPSFYEGFGLPVLEAMTCGAPVVTSRSSSLPEVAGDAALLVDPHSVDELAGAVERLLTDEGLRARLAAQGRERAARFRWEETARGTLACYRRALGGE